VVCALTNSKEELREPPNEKTKTPKENIYNPKKAVVAVI
jgi:hypothetical protein